MIIFRSVSPTRNLTDCNRREDRLSIMEKLKSIIQLRKILREMEKDVGFDELSTTERNILLVAYSFSSKREDIVKSSQIRNHDLVRLVPQATYHRALRSLLRHGFLERASNSKAKSYIVRTDLMSN